MSAKTRILRKATFNPDIKRYLLVYGILILFITIVGIPLILFWVPLPPLF